jgi:phage gpG-like protein
MAGVTYNLKLDAATNKAFSSFLNRLELPSQDYSKLKDEIGQTLREQVLLRFVDEVDPSGVPWVKSQRAALQGGQTLSDTAVLKNSMTYLVSGNSIEVGTNVEYAEPLHFGATIKPQNGTYLRVKGAYGWFTSKEINLPAREFLGLGSSDEEEILDVIKTFLEELK